MISPDQTQPPMLICTNSQTEGIKRKTKINIASDQNGKGYMACGTQPFCHTATLLFKMTSLDFPINNNQPVPRKIIIFILRQ